MDTSFNYVAAVISALVVIVTTSYNVVAFSGCLVAAVISACIVVITVNVITEESFSLSTSEDYAFVWVFLVSFIHVNLSVEASEERIARFDGTWVLVITNNSFMFNLSSSYVTPVLGTCVFVVNIYRGVYTSSCRGTTVNGTWIVVITVLLVINTSNIDITSVSGTSVTIIARNQFVNAVSGSNIARVCGTCVVVVTILLCEYRASIERVAASNGTCIRSIEYNRSVDTYSSNTFVSGTCVVIVTINSG
jgi:hypothetical protein